METEIEISLLRDILLSEVRELFYADDLMEVKIAALRAMGSLNRILILKCEQIKKGDEK